VRPLTSRFNPNRDPEPRLAAEPGWNDRVESVRNNTASYLTFINHDDHGDPANGHRLDQLSFHMRPYQQLSAVPGTATPPEHADHVIRTCVKSP
jgi:hypothetical protein